MQNTIKTTQQTTTDNMENTTQKSSLLIIGFMLVAVLLFAPSSRAAGDLSGKAAAPVVKLQKASLQQAIQQKVRYPRQALLKGVEGTVYVQFTVDKKGKVQDPTVVRGRGFGLGQAVIDAVAQLTLDRERPTEHSLPAVITVPVAFKIK